MSAIGTVELALAREVAATLFEELGIQSYMYGVEPGTESLQVIIECAFDGGWERIVLDTSMTELLVVRNDPEARRALLNAWRDRLGSCKTTT